MGNVRCSDWSFSLMQRMTMTEGQSDVAVEHHHMKQEKKTFINKGYSTISSIFTCTYLLNVDIAIFLMSEQHIYSCRHHVRQCNSAPILKDWHYIIKRKGRYSY